MHSIVCLQRLLLLGPHGAQARNSIDGLSPHYS
jgi:hypothetical protein